MKKIKYKCSVNKYDPTTQKVEEVSIIISAESKAEAKQKFKERCGKHIPLNYTIKRIK